MSCASQVSQKSWLRREWLFSSFLSSRRITENLKQDSDALIEQDK